MSEMTDTRPGLSPFVEGSAAVATLPLAVTCDGTGDHWRRIARTKAEGNDAGSLRQIAWMFPGSSTRAAISHILTEWWAPRAVRICTMIVGLSLIPSIPFAVVSPSGMP